MSIVQNLQPVENVVWNSYKGPLYAMRRTQLWRLADLHKISYPKGASKDIMLKTIESWELQNGEGAALIAPKHMDQQTFLKAIEGPRVEYDELRANPSTGQTNVHAMADVIEGVTHFETTREEPVDVESMDMPTLRKTVKALGLTQNRDMTADDLKAKIRGKDAS